MATDLPTITVVVVNHNGRDHLRDCFDSLAALDYPAESLELMLVDNASSDGSLEFAREELPSATLVASEENLGFGGGNNLGAERARGEWLVFLNNDMRVEPGFLRGLLDALEARPGAVCAGAKILNWDGTELDFAGSAAHFAGYAYQRGFGRAADDDPYTEVEPMLFACGGAMLIRRDVFLDAGGFDADFFAYYEDSDLGWRLWLLGHEVVFAPGAVVRHRHHGTTGRLSEQHRQMLYARNALSSLIKNYDDENLGRALPAALMGLASGRVRGVPEPEAAANEAAIAEVLGGLSELMRKRDLVQRARTRTDAEVLPLFRHPFRHWPGVDLQTQYRLVSELGVDEAFAHLPRRVLVVASDILPYPGLPTVGSGLRAWALGQGLAARGHDVAFSMPHAAVEGREETLPEEAVALAWEPATLPAVIARAEPDAIIACNWPVLAVLPEQIAGIPTVLDQHGPHLIEREYMGVQTPEENSNWKIYALRKADFFTCAGEIQRAYFDDWLERAGWTEHERAENTAVIPVSLPPEPPAREPEPDGPVFVYGGVFLPWQDPSLPLLTLVEAMERHGRGELHLFGGKHPVHDVDTGVMEELSERLERSPRVRSFGMVSHEELLGHYSRAHAAVDLIARNRERELAFTTRTVEYLWCGLPVIYNDYSEISRHIDDFDAGWTVDPSDAAAMRELFDRILTDPEQLKERARNAQRLVAERMSWTETIEPIDGFFRRPRLRPHPAAAVGSAPKIRTRDKFRGHYRAGGIGMVLRKGGAYARRRLRRSG